MNKPVRFGVISASPMAESHMTAIRDNADAVLTAVCDIDLEKARNSSCLRSVCLPITMRFWRFRTWMRWSSARRISCTVR